MERDNRDNHDNARGARHGTLMVVLLLGITRFEIVLTLTDRS